MIKRLAAFVLATILLITCVAYAEAPVKLTSVVTFGLDSYVLPGYDSQDRTITAIGENAFAGQNKLRVVALPSTICSIEDRAFAECTGLNAILIPETVTSFGDDLFQDGGERVTIIAPAESAAIGYAQQHGIRYIELEQCSIREADTRYIALLMFKFSGNSTYFGRYNDTDTYLLTLNEADILNMALVNRMELTWNAIIDALRANGKNSYMTEQYMLQLGSILEEMHGIQSITVDTGLIQTFTSFAAKGADSYEELVTWLLGSEYRDDPFVRSVIANGDKLEYLSTALGGFDKVMNILIYACRDYSKSIAVLDTLLSVSSNYTDKEFHDAVLSLKRLYEGNVTGILSSLLSEFYVDIGEVVTDGVLESISSGALLLYNTANFGIDFALSVEGIKDEADAQMEYVALLDISYECEEAFMTIMSGNDNSPETMANLDVLIQLCRAIRLRLYDMQISMFRNSGNASAAEELSWSRAYFFQRADIISSYTVDPLPQYAGPGDKLTTEPISDYYEATIDVEESNSEEISAVGNAAQTTVTLVNELCGHNHLSVDEAYLAEYSGDNSSSGFTATIGDGLTGELVVTGWFDTQNSSWQIDYVRIETYADLQNNEEKVASLYAALLYVLHEINYLDAKAMLLETMYNTDFSPVGEFGFDRYVELPLHNTGDIYIDISLTDNGTVWTMSISSEYDE